MAINEKVLSNYMNYIDVFIILLFLIFIAPLIIPRFLLMNILAWSMLAYAFSLMYGFLGYLSLGELAFFAIGSYIMFLPLDPIINLILAIITGFLFAILVGPIIVRKGGAYYALTNLSLSVVIYYLVLYFLKDYTGGFEGRRVILRGVVDFTLRDNVFIAIVIIFTLILLFYKILSNSTFATMLKAIRENEIRMQFLGYNTLRIKLLAYLIHGGMASLGGACLVLSQAYASATTYTPIFNSEIVVASMLGGVQSLYGPLIGTFVYIWTKHILGAVYGLGWEVIVGAMLTIIVVATKEQGICGLIGRLLKPYIYVLMSR